MDQSFAIGVKEAKVPGPPEAFGEDMLEDQTQNWVVETVLRSQ